MPIFCTLISLVTFSKNISVQKFTHILSHFKLLFKQNITDSISYYFLKYTYSTLLQFLVACESKYPKVYFM